MPKSTKKARHPKAELETTAEGATLAKDVLIERIALSMASGTWVPYRSVRKFAADQGLSLVSAQKYAAEATRILRLSWGQEEAKVAVLERIAYIGREAMERTEDAISPGGDVMSLRKPDHRTAFAAAKSLADYLGLGGINAEVVVRYQTMSDSDLWAETQKFLKQIQGTSDVIETTSTDSKPDDEPVSESDRDALDRINTRSARP